MIKALKKPLLFVFGVVFALGFLLLLVPSLFGCSSGGYGNVRITTNRSVIELDIYESGYYTTMPITITVSGLPSVENGLLTRKEIVDPNVAIIVDESIVTNNKQGTITFDIKPLRGGNTTLDLIAPGGVRRSVDIVVKQELQRIDFVSTFTSKLAVIRGQDFIVDSKNYALTPTFSTQNNTIFRLFRPLPAPSDPVEILYNGKSLFDQYSNVLPKERMSALSGLSEVILDVSIVVYRNGNSHIVSDRVTIPVVEEIIANDIRANRRFATADENGPGYIYERVNTSGGNFVVNLSENPVIDQFYNEFSSATVVMDLSINGTTATYNRGDLLVVFDAPVLPIVSVSPLLERNHFRFTRLARGKTTVTGNMGWSSTFAQYSVPFTFDINIFEEPEEITLNGDSLTNVPGMPLVFETTTTIFNILPGKTTPQPLTFSVLPEIAMASIRKVNIQIPAAQYFVNGVSGASNILFSKKNAQGEYIPFIPTRISDGFVWFDGIDSGLTIFAEKQKDAAEQTIQAVVFSAHNSAVKLNLTIELREQLVLTPYLASGLNINLNHNPNTVTFVASNANTQGLVFISNDSSFVEVGAIQTRSITKENVTTYFVDVELFHFGVENFYSLTALNNNVIIDLPFYGRVFKPLEPSNFSSTILKVDDKNNAAILSPLQPTGQFHNYIKFNNATSAANDDIKAGPVEFEISSRISGWFEVNYFLVSGSGIDVINTQNGIRDNLGFSRFRLNVLNILENQSARWEFVVFYYDELGEQQTLIIPMYFEFEPVLHRGMIGFYLHSYDEVPTVNHQVSQVIVSDFAVIGANALTDSIATITIDGSGVLFGKDESGNKKLNFEVTNISVPAIYGHNIWLRWNGGNTFSFVGGGLGEDETQRMVRLDITVSQTVGGVTRSVVVPMPILILKQNIQAVGNYSLIPSMRMAALEGSNQFSMSFKPTDFGSEKLSFTNGVTANELIFEYYEIDEKGDRIDSSSFDMFDIINGTIYRNPLTAGNAVINITHLRRFELDPVAFVNLGFAGAGNNVLSSPLFKFNGMPQTGVRLPDIVINVNMAGPKTIVNGDGTTSTIWIPTRSYGESDFIRNILDDPMGVHDIFGDIHFTSQYHIPFFGGVLDGRGNSFIGLTQTIALFGENLGEIKNLKIIGAKLNITQSTDNEESKGAKSAETQYANATALFVGINDGSINNINVGIDIVVERYVSGNVIAGGIVGVNFGNITLGNLSSSVSFTSLGDANVTFGAVAGVMGEGAQIEGSVSAVFDETVSASELESAINAAIANVNITGMTPEEAEEARNEAVNKVYASYTRLPWNFNNPRQNKQDIEVNIKLSPTGSGIFGGLAGLVVGDSHISNIAIDFVFEGASTDLVVGGAVGKIDNTEFGLDGVYANVYVDNDDKLESFGGLVGSAQTGIGLVPKVTIVVIQVWDEELQDYIDEETEELVYGPEGEIIYDEVVWKLTVDNSFVALRLAKTGENKILNGENVGGIVGYGDAVDVNNTRVFGFSADANSITLDGDNVGGFVGSVGQISLNKSFVMQTNITGAAVGGYAGRVRGNINPTVPYLLKAGQPMYEILEIGAAFIGTAISVYPLHNTLVPIANVAFDSGRPIGEYFSVENGENTYFKASYNDVPLSYDLLVTWDPISDTIAYVYNSSFVLIGSGTMNWDTGLGLFGGRPIVLQVQQDISTGGEEAYYTTIAGERKLLTYEKTITLGLSSATNSNQNIRPNVAGAGTITINSTGTMPNAVPVAANSVDIAKFSFTPSRKVTPTQESRNLTIAQKISDAAAVFVLDNKNANTVYALSEFITFAGIADNVFGIRAVLQSTVGTRVQVINNDTLVASGAGSAIIRFEDIANPNAYSELEFAFVNSSGISLTKPNGDDLPKTPFALHADESGTVLIANHQAVLDNGHSIRVASSNPGIISIARNGHAVTFKAIDEDDTTTGITVEEYVTVTIAGTEHVVAIDSWYFDVKVHQTIHSIQTIRTDTLGAIVNKNDTLHFSAIVRFNGNVGTVIAPDGSRAANQDEINLVNLVTELKDAGIPVDNAVFISIVSATWYGQNGKTHQNAMIIDFRITFNQTRLYVNNHDLSVVTTSANYNLVSNIVSVVLAPTYARVVEMDFYGNDDSMRMLVPFTEMTASRIAYIDVVHSPDINDETQYILHLPVIDGISFTVFDVRDGLTDADTIIKTRELKISQSGQVVIPILWNGERWNNSIRLQVKFSINREQIVPSQWNDYKNGKGQFDFKISRNNDLTVSQLTKVTLHTSSDLNIVGLVDGGYVAVGASNTFNITNRDGEPVSPLDYAFNFALHFGQVKVEGSLVHTASPMFAASATSWYFPRGGIEYRIRYENGQYILTSSLPLNKEAEDALFGQYFGLSIYTSSAYCNNTEGEPVNDLSWVEFFVQSVELRPVGERSAVVASGMSHNINSPLRMEFMVSATHAPEWTAKIQPKLDAFANTIKDAWYNANHPNYNAVYLSSYDRFSGQNVGLTVGTIERDGTKVSIFDRFVINEKIDPDSGSKSHFITGTSIAKKSQMPKIDVEVGFSFVKGIPQLWPLNNNPDMVPPISSFEFEFFRFSSADYPEPIYNKDDLQNMNMTLGGHYRLAANIIIDEHVPFLDSAGGPQFLTLDGNGYAIYIRSFSTATTNHNVREGTMHLGLFDTLPAGSIVKNLTVLYRQVGSIPVEGAGSANSSSERIIIPNEISNVIFGGIAAINNGFIVNGEVLSFCLVNGLKSDLNPVAVRDENRRLTVQGNATVWIESGPKTVVTFGGLVGQNNSNITNSRVGRSIDSDYKYIGYGMRDLNNYLSNSAALTNNNSQSYIPDGNSVSIVANGIVGGFVGQNFGTIAASYYAQGRIINVHSDVEFSQTGGFAAQNYGKITTSFTEGIRVAPTGSEGDESGELEAILVEGGGIDSSGYIGGFVFANNSGDENNPAIIEDCFVNISLFSNARTAGFVIDNKDGYIAQCYAFTHATLTRNNAAFATNRLKPSENTFEGTIENSFYYSNNASETPEPSDGPKEADRQTKEAYWENSDEKLAKLSENDVGIQKNYIAFTFTSTPQGDDGIWRMNPGEAPKLVAANKIGVFSSEFQDQFVLDDDKETQESFGNSAVFLSVPTGYDQYIYIRTCEQWNEMITMYEHDSLKKDGVVNFNNYRQKHYRLISDINFVQSTEAGFAPASVDTATLDFRGILDGNGFTLSNISVLIKDTVGVTHAGLFARIVDHMYYDAAMPEGQRIGYTQAVVKNLRLEMQGVDAGDIRYAGAVAGEVVNSGLFDITVAPVTGHDGMVSAFEVAGGVVGIVQGDSRVHSVFSSVPVRTTVTQSYASFGTVTNGTFETIKEHNVSDPLLITRRQAISYAGGIIGVATNSNTLISRNAMQAIPSLVNGKTIDSNWRSMIFVDRDTMRTNSVNVDESMNRYKDAPDNPAFAQFRRLQTSGENLELTAVLVGGVFGFLGEGYLAHDTRFLTPAFESANGHSGVDATTASWGTQRFAAIYAAGGIAAEQRGNLTYARTEAENQTDIDKDFYDTVATQSLDWLNGYRGLFNFRVVSGLNNEVSLPANRLAAFAGGLSGIVTGSARYAAAQNGADRMYFDNGRIIDSYSKVPVLLSFERLYHDSTSANNNIGAYNYAGGIAGYAHNSNIEYGFTTSFVVAYNAGGIVGYYEQSTLENGEQSDEYFIKAFNVLTPRLTATKVGHSITDLNRQFDKFFATGLWNKVGAGVPIPVDSTGENGGLSKYDIDEKINYIGSPAIRDVYNRNALYPGSNPFATGSADSAQYTLRGLLEIFAWDAFNAREQDNYASDWVIFNSSAKVLPFPVFGINSHLIEIVDTDSWASLSENLSAFARVKPENNKLVLTENTIRIPDDFSGTLFGVQVNGENPKIYINNTMPLFESLQNARVMNIDFVVTGNVKAANMTSIGLQSEKWGVIAGRADYTLFNNVKVTFEKAITPINTTTLNQQVRSVGGFVGTASESTFVNCEVRSETAPAVIDMTLNRNNTTLIQDAYVGGFVGLVTNTTFTDCKVSNINISQSGSLNPNSTTHMGGVFGMSTGDANGASSTAMVDVQVNSITLSVGNNSTMLANIGGVFGSGYLVTAESELKTDNVRLIGVTTLTGSTNIGGFVGNFDGGYIGNSWVEGTKKITGTTAGSGSVIGGFVGRHEGGRISGISSVSQAGASSIMQEGVVRGTTELQQGNFVGGFVGMTNGGITDNCRVKGTLSMTNGTRTNAGGFAGVINDGEISNSGTLDGFRDSGNKTDYLIKLAGTNVGGFAGTMNNGKVTNCFAQGRIISASTLAGGFVAKFANGTIDRSFTHVDIQSVEQIVAPAIDRDSSIGVDGKAGGFVGEANAGTISGCYATGNVIIRSTDTNNAAGFVQNAAGTIFKENFTISRTYLGITAPTSRSDINKVKGFYATGSLPKESMGNKFAHELAPQSDLMIGAVNWTSVTAMRGNEAGLDRVDLVDLLYPVVDSLYKGRKVVSADAEIANFEKANTRFNPTKIGNYTAQTKFDDVVLNNYDYFLLETDAVRSSSFGTFRGVLVGARDSKDPSTQARTATINTNLFGTLDNAIISYVRLAGTNISGRGALANIAQNYSFIHAVSTESGSKVVSSSNNTGGLVGELINSTIESSHNNAIVQVKSNSNLSNIGGLVGNMSGASLLLNSFNGGLTSFDAQTATATAFAVGGLVGVMSNTSKIDHSYNIAPIKAAGNVGGVVGEMQDTSAISNVYNAGLISTTYNAGGLVYSISGTNSARVSNAYNTGAINAGFSTTLSNTNQQPLVYSTTLSNALANSVYYNIDLFEYVEQLSANNGTIANRGRSYLNGHNTGTAATHLNPALANSATSRFGPAPDPENKNNPVSHRILPLLSGNTYYGQFGGVGGVRATNDINATIVGGQEFGVGANPQKMVNDNKNIFTLLGSKTNISNKQNASMYIAEDIVADDATGGRTPMKIHETPYGGFFSGITVFGNNRSIDNTTGHFLNNIELSTVANLIYSGARNIAAGQGFGGLVRVASYSAFVGVAFSGRDLNTENIEIPAIINQPTRADLAGGIVGHADNVSIYNSAVIETDIFVSSNGTPTNPYNVGLIVGRAVDTRIINTYATGHIESSVDNPTETTIAGIKYNTTTCIGGAVGHATRVTMSNVTVEATVHLVNSSSGAVTIALGADRTNGRFGAVIGEINGTGTTANNVIYNRQMQETYVGESNTAGSIVPVGKYSNSATAISFTANAGAAMSGANGTSRTFITPRTNRFTRTPVYATSPSHLPATHQRSLLVGDAAGSGLNGIRGVGTARSPFMIASVEQYIDNFYGKSGAFNKTTDVQKGNHFILTDNLVLSQNFDTIAAFATNIAQVSLDGRGHIIQDFSISTDSRTTGEAMFDTLRATDVVCNIYFVDPNVNISIESGDANIRSAIIARYNKGTIDKVAIDGGSVVVDIRKNNTGSFASFGSMGAFAGENSGTISNVSSTAMIRADAETGNVGGLVGLMNGSTSRLENAYASGIVSSFGTVNSSNSGNATGSINGSTYVDVGALTNGATIGTATSGSVRTVYYNSDLGVGRATTGGGVSFNSFGASSTVTNFGDKFVKVYRTTGLSDSAFNAGLPLLSGHRAFVSSLINRYGPNRRTVEVRTGAQGGVSNLANISSTTGAYHLTQNITSASGLPSASSGFSGTIHGNGFVIANLNTNQRTISNMTGSGQHREQGMFQNVTSATFNDLIFVNPRASATVTAPNTLSGNGGSLSVGIIAGTRSGDAYTTINRSSVFGGFVRAEANTSVSGNNDVNDVIYDNYYADFSYSNSWKTGWTNNRTGTNAIGTAVFVGGFIGRDKSQYSDATIISTSIYAGTAKVTVNSSNSAISLYTKGSSAVTAGKAISAGVRYQTTVNNNDYTYKSGEYRYGHDARSGSAIGGNAYSGALYTGAFIGGSDVTSVSNTKINIDMRNVTAGLAKTGEVRGAYCTVDSGYGYGGYAYSGYASGGSVYVNVSVTNNVSTKSRAVAAALQAGSATSGYATGGRAWASMTGVKYIYGGYAYVGSATTGAIRLNGNVVKAATIGYYGYAYGGTVGRGDNNASKMAAGTISYAGSATRPSSGTTPYVSLYNLL